jgi:hypothetical protein
MMAFARDVYTATAAQTDFTISFPYLDGVDVLVYANGSLQTEGASNDYTIISTTIVRFNSGRTSGDTIVLQRSTSQTTRLVDYATASTLTEEDLDNDSLQAFYMSQESIDIANTALVLDGNDEWDFQSKQSASVPAPTSGDSVVNKTYVDALSVAAGNVPTPDNPGEDNYFLKASAGAWDWFNMFGTANTWSAAQTFVDTDAGAAAGPVLELKRDSASPAAADVLGQIKFTGEDSASNSDVYGQVSAVIDDPTTTSEDGRLAFATVVAGTLSDVLHMGVGLYMDGATGGDKGADTVNASAYYVNGEGPVGKVLQIVKVQDGEVATGTTTIPHDDTVPQNTEGDEYMTLSITPKSANSRLQISVTVHLAHSAVGVASMRACLFRDSGASAIAVGMLGKDAAATAACMGTFIHDMASPGTSSTTFKVRCGNSNAGTTTFNGVTGGRFYGGLLASSIIITEYLT